MGENQNKECGLVSWLAKTRKPMFTKLYIYIHGHWPPETCADENCWPHIVCFRLRILYTVDHIYNIYTHAPTAQHTHRPGGGRRRERTDVVLVHKYG